MENKRHQPEEENKNGQKLEKTPVQPEEPVGDISSSGDSARLPERDNTPPDEQTRGNP